MILIFINIFVTYPHFLTTMWTNCIFILIFLTQDRLQTGDNLKVVFVLPNIIGDHLRGGLQLFSLRVWGSDCIPGKKYYSGKIYLLSSVKYL